MVSGAIARPGGPDLVGTGLVIAAPASASTVHSKVVLASTPSLFVARSVTIGDSACSGVPRDHRFGRGDQFERQPFRQPFRVEFVHPFA